MKKSKEGLKMLGVKRIKQESETQSKAACFYGHFWGCVGIVIGSAAKLACLPLLLRLHDGLRETADWDKSEETGEGQVTRPLSEACRYAAPFGSALLLLDRLYPSVDALRVLGFALGKGTHRKLRFVLVREGGSRFILFSMDLSLLPADIVRLYFLRFRVENAFRELK